MTSIYHQLAARALALCMNKEAANRVPRKILAEIANQKYTKPIGKADLKKMEEQHRAGRPVRDIVREFINTQRNEPNKNNSLVNDAKLPPNFEEAKRLMSSENSLKNLASDYVKRNKPSDLGDSSSKAIVPAGQSSRAIVPYDANKKPVVSPIPVVFKKSPNPGAGASASSEEAYYDKLIREGMDKIKAMRNAKLPSSGIGTAGKVGLGLGAAGLAGGGLAYGLSGSGGAGASAAASSLSAVPIPSVTPAAAPTAAGASATGGSPFYTNPLFMVPAGLGLLGAGAYMAERKKKRRSLLGSDDE